MKSCLSIYTQDWCEVGCLSSYTALEVALAGATTMAPHPCAEVRLGSVYPPVCPGALNPGVICTSQQYFQFLFSAQAKWCLQCAQVSW